MHPAGVFVRLSRFVFISVGSEAYIGAGRSVRTCVAV